MSSVAVIVTVTGPKGPSGAPIDQLQVPKVSFRVTVPTSAAMVTVPLPCGSENVPVLVASPPSSAVTTPSSAATTGG